MSQVCHCEYPWCISTISVMLQKLHKLQRHQIAVLFNLEHLPPPPWCFLLCCHFSQLLQQSWFAAHYLIPLQSGSGSELSFEETALPHCLSIWVELTSPSAVAMGRDRFRNWHINEPGLLEVNDIPWGFWEKEVSFFIHRWSQQSSSLLFLDEELWGYEPPWMFCQHNGKSLELLEVTVWKWGRGDHHESQSREKSSPCTWWQYLTSLGTSQISGLFSCRSSYIIKNLYPFLPLPPSFSLSLSFLGQTELAFCPL